MSLSDRIVLRRSTILADAHVRGGYGPLSRGASTDAADVRVGNYEWPTLRDHASTRPRRVERRIRVGGDVADEIKPWLVVSTDFSRTSPDTKAAIPVGSVVRFTVQRQYAPTLWKTKDDTSEMAILRGRIVATRSPLLDSYAIQETEVVSTHDLDASISPPTAGQIFLVSPDAVGSIESIGSAPPLTMVIPSTSEFAGPMHQLTASTPPPGWTLPIVPSVSLATPVETAAPAASATSAPDGASTAASSAPVVVPKTTPGTTASLATEPAGLSGTSIAIAIGVLLAGVIGLTFWRLA